MAKAKGIVLESNNGYSTILMEGGQYIKINRTMQIGQIYQQENQYRKFLLAAAVVLVFMLLAAVDFFHVVAYANVSNGIEIGVNRWNRIIKVERLKTNAKTPAEYSALKGQKLEEAVPIVVKNALTVDDDQAEITIRVKSEKQNGSTLEAKLMEKIETSVEEEFNIHGQGNVKADDQDKNSIRFKLKNDPQITQDRPGDKNQIKPDKENDQIDYEAGTDGKGKQEPFELKNQSVNKGSPERE